MKLTLELFYKMMLWLILQTPSSFFYVSKPLKKYEKIDYVVIWLDEYDDRYILSNTNDIVEFQVVRFVSHNYVPCLLVYSIFDGTEEFIGCTWVCIE